MKCFARYDPATGKILAVGQVPESMIELQGENVWVGEVNPQHDYMLGGAPTARPPMPVTLPTTVVADGTTELLIRGVPIGAQLRVAGPVSMSGTVEQGGDVTLTFALAGEYRIVLESFPFLNLEASIYAV